MLRVTRAPGKWKSPSRVSAAGLSERLLMTAAASKGILKRVKAWGCSEWRSAYEKSAAPYALSRPTREAHASNFACLGPVRRRF